MKEQLVEQFIASYRKAPPVIILDFDGTDTPVHGNQEGRFFHGYYDCHCFLPLYVFCGDQLLVAYLRRSNIDVAKHAAAILKLLVRRLRKAWPRTRIVFRGDSGFCRDLLLSWCDRNDVKYVVGIARNERLVAEAADLMQQARVRFEATGEKQRLFMGSTMPQAPGGASVGSSRRLNTPIKGPIRVSWSPISWAMPRRSTTAATVCVVRRKTGSRSR